MAVDHIAMRGPLLGLAAMLAVLLQLPSLDTPLLEGAAVKQTHTAMVARNLYRGRATFARPVVDDLGTPGYFVKELPVIPWLVSVLYRSLGVHEWIGRLVSLLAWLAAVPALATLLRGSGPLVGGIGALWLLVAPMSVVYGRAFMTDPAMVTVSLLSLVAFARWCERPSRARTAVAAASYALALLLKPHAAFWLTPAAIVLIARSGASRSRARVAGLLGALVACCLAPAAWYGHAAGVHRSFPVPGAVVAEGWVDPGLLADPRLYAEIGRQVLCMVFTPAGLAVAALGVAARRRPYTPNETALLAWGAGTIAQCLVLSTRMFDDLARGTEYYQLPLVPVAGMLIGRGAEALDKLLRAYPRGLRTTTFLACGSIVIAGALVVAVHAGAVPDRYRSLLDDCALVQSVTTPRDQIVVLADRGGIVHYYCDRRGMSFVPARTLPDALRGSRPRGESSRLAEAFANARYVYLPFDDLFPPGSPWLVYLEQEWRRVPTPGRSLRLYERPTESSHHSSARMLGTTPAA